MKKKKISAWGILIIFILFIAIIIGIIQHRNPLPDHGGGSGGPTMSSSTPNKSEPPIIEIVPYTNENPPFTVSVPADWTKVVKGGYTTWVDKKTASSFQIQIGDSDPAILEVTRDTVAAELSAIGAELVNFYWIDEWDFACWYRVYTENGTVANIEMTAFNRRHIVRFVFMLNETYYNQLESTVALIIDSFAWDRWAG